LVYIYRENNEIGLYFGRDPVAQGLAAPNLSILVADIEFYPWWHEQQEIPERNVNAWAVIDAWMKIFLKNFDCNESIFGL
jgi:hypothetical protein